MRRYGLRDDQFVRIEHLLPGRPGYVGRNSELGNRLFVEAVIWKFRSGAPWRDLPERFGAWKTGPVATCVGIDWRVFGRHEAIRSCGEVNDLIVWFLGEGLPSVDLAHGDLS